jgi:hypothetical protein
VVREIRRYVSTLAILHDAILFGLRAAQPGCIAPANFCFAASQERNASECRRQIASHFDVRSISSSNVHSLSEPPPPWQGRYLEKRRTYRTLGRPFFTDKMGANFLHLGLIRLILPDAGIVDVRRHPMACCWSNFTQLFAKGQTCAYRLADLGRLCRDCVDLMAHFDRVLPGRGRLRMAYFSNVSKYISCT